jgi:hypothetical protein
MLTTNQRGLTAETAIVHECVKRGILRLYSNRRGPAGMITRRYTPDEVDGFAAFCLGTNACYFLPAEFASQRQVHLRLGATKNNQQNGVRWARDYEFGATLRRLQGP